MSARSLKCASVCEHRTCAHQFSIHLNVNSLFHFNMFLRASRFVYHYRFSFSMKPSVFLCHFSYSFYLFYSPLEFTARRRIFKFVLLVHMIIRPVRKYLFNNLFDNVPAFKHLIQISKEKVSTKG